MLDLYFDIESHNVGKEYSLPPEEFVRLIQYAWDDGPVQRMTDVEEFRGMIAQARYIIGHNIINFDLGALFGVDSLDPLWLTYNRKVIDTFVVASLVVPIPAMYYLRNGRKATTFSQGRQKPELIAKYLKLDNLCFQFDLPGKMGDLDALARKYNPKGTLKADLDYSLIPLDDPEFQEYADQDVVADRGLWKYLEQQIEEQEYDREYIWRELLIAGITAQISRNGVSINEKMAQERVDALQAKKDEVMDWLVKEYDFPTSGKSPWASDAGKAVIFQVLADNGITAETHPEWARTATGNLSLGGEEIIRLTEGTEIEDFGIAMSTLKGQRSLAQLALDSIYPDGKAHPDITFLQRSGRWSFTNPGLTVWTKNEEKKYIVAAPGKVLVELDYSAADARAMAALSGDMNFRKRFEDESKKPHDYSGEAFFGADAYWRDRDAFYPPSKALGHALSYNCGAFKAAHTLNAVCQKNGVDLHFWAPKHPKSQSPLPAIERQPDSLSTVEMIENFDNQYGWLKRFKQQAVDEGDEFGYVTNTWGRRMKIDSGRSYTQGPALYGQSTTRELMADALIRLIEHGEYFIRSIKAIIHDALLVEFDEWSAEDDAQVVRECMEVDFDPGTPVGIPIPFPVGIGPPAHTWYDCSHEQ